ncbi:MAG: dTMP kinase [Phycisphaerae bacterium]|nr:dTMP kinase [Phycisphaerae bacterium]
MFEGPDGSGKSTQLRRLVELVTASGVGVCEVREPGGTKIGEAIRQVLLQRDHDCMTLRCEMLLYMASRAQLVEQKIRPALARGELVVADRFVTSTVAYQGAAQGLPYDEITAAARIAVGVNTPDLVLVFDVDEETAAQRAGIVAPKGKGKRGDGGTSSLFADRMEDRTREFRRRVRQSYLDQAQGEPERFRVIDAAKGPDEVWRALVETMEKWAGGDAGAGGPAAR